MSPVTHPLSQGELTALPNLDGSCSARDSLHLDPGYSLAAADSHIQKTFRSVHIHENTHGLLQTHNHPETEMGTHRAVYPERVGHLNESWCSLGPHTDTL